MSEKRWLVGLVVAGKRETWGLGLGSRTSQHEVAMRHHMMQHGLGPYYPGPRWSSLFQWVPFLPVPRVRAQRHGETISIHLAGLMLNATSEATREHLIDESSESSESQSESEMLDYRWLCKSAMAEGLLLVRNLLTFVPHDQQ